MPIDNGNLPFLAICAGGLIFFVTYISYIWFWVEPAIEKATTPREPEAVLDIGMFGCMITLAGLWIFAWTARASVHWIVPIIGVTLFAGGNFWSLQCLFAWLSEAYPVYAASLFAANDFMRSTLAFALLIAGVPLYRNLGVSPGCSLTAALLTALTPGYFILYCFGKNLRARSRFAVTDVSEKDAPIDKEKM